jgi:2-methylcitrate dehydratase PrpD
VTAITRQLAEVLSQTRFEHLPEQVKVDARRSVLDWLGSALAGSVEAPARMIRRVVAGLGSSDEATVFCGGRASAAGAALANGVASHILELDDVHKGSTLHPAAPIIPAALAVAEREHSSGENFLLAVVLGYEAALRIGEAINPSHYRFWHPTGTAATFGAAVAAGSLLHLSADQMLMALGTAGTQAAGLWEFNADGAMSKHLHPGKAAFNGVLSADLAREGFTGASRILEGERGFFRAMSSSWNGERITDGLGSCWKITENCYKLHSCCGHTHTAIDMALEIAKTNVTGIHIQTYAAGYEIVKEMQPRTPYQAQFSIAYCVAAALLDGAVGLAQFTPERLCDPRITALLARTRVTVDPELTAKYPAAWPVRLSVTLDDGTVIHKTSDFPRGNPETPVPTAVLEQKFLALLEPRFGSESAQAALLAAHSVDRYTDMATLLRRFA